MAAEKTLKPMIPGSNMAGSDSNNLSGKKDWAYSCNNLKWRGISERLYIVPSRIEVRTVANFGK